jgi:mRNA interferase RelE/StbE
MSTWSLRTTSNFDKSLTRLDKPIRLAVKNYLTALLELDDPRLRGKALTGKFAGYWRYRVSDFRIVVEIADQELILLAIDVAHRSRIYRG